jgi:hypothetical protein
MNLQQLLQNKPKARERKNKWRAVGWVLKQTYPQLHGIDPATLSDILAQASTLSRNWRKLLRDNPELRGSDYHDKYELEHRKRTQLGYPY